MKITMIGGGSYSWASGMFSNLLNNQFFGRETELCLYDINEFALNEIYGFCQGANIKYPDHAITLTKTLNFEEALYGADYVMVAISHGGLEAELEDHRIARRNGFYNIKGSESGVAGASRTVRHVPEFVRIAKAMNRLCPGAMLLNVTNPLTALTRCVEKYENVKAMGFCHGIKNHLEILLPYFGADSFDDVSFVVSGVDHCSFMLDIKYKGQDALQIMRDKGMIEAAWRGHTIEYDDPFAGRENQRIRFILWDILGYMPGLSDEHCGEFYYQAIGTPELREKFGMHYDRIDDRVKAATRLRENIQNKIKAGEVADCNRHGEVIDEAIAALHGGKPFYDVLNYRNDGQVPNLPLGTVVETLVNIDATGIHPVMTPPMPKVVDAIVRPQALREELFMEAAMEHDVNKLASALAIDPIVNDFLRVKKVAQEIFDYNDQFNIKD